MGWDVTGKLKVWGFRLNRDTRHMSIPVLTGTRTYSDGQGAEDAIDISSGGA